LEEVETIAKTTAHQRLVRHQQPFTIVRPPHYIEGVPFHQVFGYTFEEKFDEGNWQGEWEQHDLGLIATLAVAYETAGLWRSSLVGQFAVAG